MSFRISVGGAAAEAVRATVPTLVSDGIASGITALNPALWGPGAETEAALKLTAKDRRELQRRLNLAGFKPGKTSPNFGPSQRAAIKQWQTTRALTATGFLAPMQLKALRAQTEPAYQRALAEEAKPAPAPRTRAVTREPAEPQHRARGGVAYERDPVIRRDLERERAGGGNSAAGAAIFGTIVGGAIGGALGGGFRR